MFCIALLCFALFCFVLLCFGQTKLFARPVSGILHALVYWGFLVITIGTVEMMVDDLCFLKVLGQLAGRFLIVV